MQKISIREKLQIQIILYKFKSTHNIIIIKY